MRSSVVAASAVVGPREVEVLAILGRRTSPVAGGSRVVLVGAEPDDTRPNREPPHQVPLIKHNCFDCVNSHFRRDQRAGRRPFRRTRSRRPANMFFACASRPVGGASPGSRTLHARFKHQPTDLTSVAMQICPGEPKAMRSARRGSHGFRGCADVRRTTRRRRRRDAGGAWTGCWCPSSGRGYAAHRPWPAHAKCARTGRTGSASWH